MKKQPSLISILTLCLLLPKVSAAQDCGSAEGMYSISGGTYYLAQPDRSELTGLVIHLHGGGGTGKGMLNSGLAKEALERGYLVVAPNGEHPENRWTKDWSVQAENMSFARDDISFLADVLNDVQENYNAADLPVLLAGFSRGASMTWNVACQTPDFADAYPEEALFLTEPDIPASRCFPTAWTTEVRDEVSFLWRSVQ